MGRFFLLLFLPPLFVEEMAMSELAVDEIERRFPVLID